jgi:hypothetical protein
MTPATPPRLQIDRPLPADLRTALVDQLTAALVAAYKQRRRTRESTEDRSSRPSGASEQSKAPSARGVDDTKLIV